MIKIYYTNEKYLYFAHFFYIDEETFKKIGLKVINEIAADNIFIQTKKANAIEGMLAKVCLKRTNKLDDILYHNYHYLSIKRKTIKKEEKKEGENCCGKA